MTDSWVSRRIVIYASVCGAAGVLLGAWSAHGLESVLQDRGYDASLVGKRMNQFEVGVRYHLVHAVALLALAAIPSRSPNRRRWVARSFLAGIVLFSGSLYLLVLTNTPVLGAITPLGGLSWIAGWLALIWMVGGDESA